MVMLSQLPRQCFKCFQKNYINVKIAFAALSALLSLLRHEVARNTGAAA